MAAATILQALKARLLADVPLQALVAGRVWLKGEEHRLKSRPFVLIGHAGSDYEFTFEVAHLEELRSEVECWSRGYVQAEAVARAVKNCLDWKTVSVTDNVSVYLLPTAYRVEVEGHRADGEPLVKAVVSHMVTTKKDLVA